MIMTEMQYGETIIKVHPTKVDEMLAKGWVIIEETGTSEPEDVNDDLIIEE